RHVHPLAVLRAQPVALETRAAVAGNDVAALADGLDVVVAWAEQRMGGDAVGEGEQPLRCRIGNYLFAVDLLVASGKVPLRPDHRRIAVEPHGEVEPVAA